LTAGARFAELKVLRWHDRITGLLAGERLGPIRANIDLTNLCNHKCYFCEPLAFREQTVRDRKHTLDTTVTLGLLDELKNMGCVTLILSGGGEPMLHPDFGHVLAHAKGLGLKTSVVTNGSYIRKWLDYLSAADVVRISLDSSSHAQHVRMHGGKDFEQIIDGIQSLKGKTEIGISYIIDAHNDSEEDIRWIEDLSERMGAFLQLKPLSNEKWEARAWPKHISDNPNFVEKRHRDVFFQREYRECYASQSIAVISANGEACACCDRRDLVYGSVYEKPFSEIWQSRRHKEVSRSIAPQLCTRCLMCDYNRSVEQNIVNDQSRSWMV